MNRLPLALMMALLLAGCSTLRSDYQSPRTSLPPQWQQPVTGTATLQQQKWWHAFGDPRLDALIEQALTRNNDLALAALKLQKARMQAGLTDTTQWPTPAAELGASSSKAWETGNGSTRSYHASASLSYELDLWGRLAASRDAARWEAEASAEERAATALSLIGNTAGYYWQIAYLNEAITLGEQSLADTRRALQLAEVKYRAGAVGELDLLQARQDLASQEAALSDLRNQREQARTALALLFDAAPEQHQAERANLQQITLPEVAAGLPASLLSRRPDLRASEWRLRSTLATADNTRLSLYPVFSLTGSAGGSSLALSNVLSNPIATLGAGLSLPFVDWQRQQIQIDMADNDYQQAVVSFRQDLYNALGEVENALAARHYYQLQGEQLASSLALAKRSEQLAEVKYRNGASSLQDWLDEQKKRRSAELALSQNRLSLLKNQMSLYQALGGSAVSEQTGRAG